MYLGAIFIASVMVLNIFIIRSKKANKPFEKFAEDNIRANQAQKKDIPEDLYVHPDIEVLPFEEYAEGDPQYHSLTRARDGAIKKANKSMLKLPHGMHNNDIKHAFGASNFENVVNKEENYNAYINALQLWARELIKAKKHDKAEIVLNEAVRLKSDLSQSYIMLFDLYKETGAADKQKKLTELVKSADFMSHSVTVRNKIMAHISQTEASK